MRARRWLWVVVLLAVAGGSQAKTTERRGVVTNTDLSTEPIQISECGANLNS